jgi:hypothetical protein
MTIASSCSKDDEISEFDVVGTSWVYQDDFDKTELNFISETLVQENSCEVSDGVCINGSETSEQISYQLDFPNIKIDFTAPEEFPNWEYKGYFTENKLVMLNPESGAKIIFQKK